MIQQSLSLAHSPSLLAMQQPEHHRTSRLGFLYPKEHTLTPTEPHTPVITFFCRSSHPRTPPLPSSLELITGNKTVAMVALFWSTEQGQPEGSGAAFRPRLDHDGRGVAAGWQQVGGSLVVICRAKGMCRLLWVRAKQWGEAVVFSGSFLATNKRVLRLFHSTKPVSKGLFSSSKTEEESTCGLVFSSKQTPKGLSRWLFTAGKMVATGWVFTCGYFPVIRGSQGSCSVLCLDRTGWGWQHGVLGCRRLHAGRGVDFVEQQQRWCGGSDGMESLWGCFGSNKRGEGVGFPSLGSMNPQEDEADG